jgi:ABC-type cobalamin/Fe3+-siderophores transport system ATPase subunit
MPLVELQNVNVGEDGKRLLGPVSLAVDAGQFWGLVGPNGAGKTTLLRALAGLQPVIEGTVLFHDRPRPSLSRAERRLARRSIGILFQRHDFLPDLPFTVEDIVLFGRVGLSGMGRFFTRRDREAAERAMETFNLTELRRRLYRDLSGGERQKTQLARLLAQEAELLLIDEPAAGLDLDWQERFSLLIEEIFLREGKAVLMVTHDVGMLPAGCDSVLLLKEGRVEACGPPARVLNPETLSRLYGCPMEVAERRGRFHAFSLGLSPGERSGFSA